MPVYLFWGEEDFNIDIAAKELRGKLLDADWGAINHKVLEEPSLKVLLESIETTPMMFGNLVIEVNAKRHFTRGKSSDGQSSNDDEKLTARLIENINSLNPSIHLVFICKIERGSNKKIDSVKKLVKAVSKVGEVREFPVFKNYQEDKICDWIKNRLKPQKISIKPDAASFLIFQTGTDLRKIDTELEKLITYIYPRKEITKNDVDLLCSNSENVFRMTDLWIQDEKSKAIFELKKLLEKNVPVKIAAVMQSVLKKCIKIKIESANHSPQELAKILGLPPFIVGEEIKKLKNVPLERLIEQRHKLNNYEFLFKTGKINGETALEMVLAT